MKKCYSLLRWPCQYRMCSTDVYCSKQTGGSSTKEAITHHFFVSGVGRRKLSMQPKFVAAQKMLLKQKQQTFVNGLLGFCCCLRSAGSAMCYYSGRVAWVAYRYGQLYLHCSLIYFWVRASVVFLHSDQPLSEGEIIPFSGVCQSGEAALSTPEAVVSFTHWLTDCWCATDDDQRQHHHAEHHFQL